MNLRRLKAVTKKELLHIVRDARSLTLALALPLVMLLLFGYALTLDVDRIPTYVYDQDHTPESRELIDQFRGSRYFQILEATSTTTRRSSAASIRARILLSIVVAQDYSRHLLAGDEADVQMLGRWQRFQHRVHRARLCRRRRPKLCRRSCGRTRRSGAAASRCSVPVDPRIRVWYNSDLKSRNFIVPGLIAVTMMIIASMLSSLTIAREWENGTMEQLLSTPVRPGELVLGKLLAYFALGLADMLICHARRRVHVSSSVPRQRVVPALHQLPVPVRRALLGNLSFRHASRSQLMAYQMGMLSSFLPGYLLSGFIYSIHNMPKVIQVDQLPRARALFRHHLERRVSERRRISHPVARGFDAGRLRGPGFLGASRKMRLKVA